MTAERYGKPGVLVQARFSSGHKKEYECTGTRHAYYLIRKLMKGTGDTFVTVEGWAPDRDNRIMWEWNNFKKNGHHLLDRNNSHYDDSRMM